jgi:lysophospholipase L1-like esterase
MTLRMASRVFGIIAGATIFVSCLITYWQPRLVRQTISTENIIQHNANAFVTEIPVFWLYVQPSEPPWLGLGGSHLSVFEDGKPLGPGNSIHTVIAENGHGRFSFWHGYLYFSSSDNSDPRINGRKYEYGYALQLNPILAGLAAIVLIAAAAGRRRMVWFSSKVLPRLVAVVVGLAIAIIPIELLLRTDWVRLNVLGSLGSYDHFPERLRPTLNSLGFRDIEHAKAKPANVFRVLILGDSMTFGHGLADNEIWPRRLAQLAGPNVEIITMARDGWSTADELDAFRRFGVSFDPDAVIIGVVDNDLQPPQTEPSGQQPEWRIFTSISTELDLFRWIDYIINRWGDQLGLRYSYSQWLKDTFNPEKPYLKRWRATVADFGKELRSRKITAFAFVLISPVGPSDPSTIRRYNTLRDEFAAQGFHTVNLHDKFVKTFGPETRKDLWAMPNDPHPGAAVNRFFAREVWNVLKEWLPRDTSPVAGGSHVVR